MMALMITGCTTTLTIDSSYREINRFQAEYFGGEVIQLEHKKSGAYLVLVKNKDPARTFVATFKTPPYDNSGVFHVFEHAVLAGSRLYPSKSNFFEVDNSSLSSMVNAFTAKESTGYVFVTRDSKDFKNLLSVYMDAVFFPNVLKESRLFKREGWRFEVDNKSNKLSLNGIAYSEMKGSLDKPYRKLLLELYRTMLPQTPYAFEHGGHPDHMPDLKFEQLVSAHKKYYHPQNSLIFLYGDLDFSQTLKTMDKNFLSHFKKEKDFVSPPIPLQKNFNYPSKVVKTSYPGAKGPGKDFVVQSFILGDQLNYIEREAFDVMVHALVDEESSPLKLRTLKEKVASGVYLTHLGKRDNVHSFIFSGTSKSKRKKIASILQQEIKNIARNGFDQNLLESILNKREFRVREKFSNGSNRGMALYHTVIENYLYGDTPLEEQLDVNRTSKRVRSILNNKQAVKDYFKKYLLNPKGTRTLVMTPDPKYRKRFEERVEKRIKKALAQKPLSWYTQEDRAYRKWNASREPSEITMKTPRLKVSDIKPKEKAIEWKHAKIENTKLIEYPQKSGNISYLQLYFDLKGVPEEDIKKLPLLINFIKKMDTANYSFLKLGKEINTYTGGIDFSFRHYQSMVNRQQFRPTLVVNIRYLNQHRSHTKKLVQELLVHHRFTPIPRIQDLFKEYKTSLQNTINDHRQSFIVHAIQKKFFPMLGSFRNEIKGVPHEQYILKEKIERQRLSASLRSMARKIFNRQRLYLATIVSDREELQNNREQIVSLRNALPVIKEGDAPWKFSQQTTYHGFSTNSTVQFIGQATQLEQSHGSTEVYATYLYRKFLTPQLREQRGAYTPYAIFNPYSNIFQMFSSKDPNLKSTFAVFDQSVNFMKEEKFNQEELDSLIIGSLKPYYRDKSVTGKAQQMTDLYLIDASWKVYMKRKREILSTTAKDFARITNHLETAWKQSIKAVVGNPQKIKSEAPFIKNVLPLPK